ncbi:MAG: mechanosensitive ion channel family protein [Acidimicrobiia bacterium]
MTFWDRLLEELRSLGETLIEWLVIIAIALVILIIGRIIIKWIRNITEKALGASWMDNVWKRSGINSALEASDQTAASITATVVYAYLMVALWLVVARVLRLTTIEDLLERLLAWIPLLILAAVVVIIAAAVASWTADLVRPFALDKSVPWLTWIVQISVIVFGVLVAMNLLKISFAEDVVKIVIAAAGIALAIAFGVGGIDSAKLWWAKYASPGVTQREEQAMQQREHHEG